MKALKSKVLSVIVAVLAGVTLAYAGVRVEKNAVACGVCEHPALYQLAAGYGNSSLAL
jgi:hypothetical protein